MRRCEDKALLVLQPSHLDQRQDVPVLRSKSEAGSTAGWARPTTHDTAIPVDHPPPPLVVFGQLRSRESEGVVLNQRCIERLDNT